MPAQVEGGFFLLARQLIGPESWLMSKPPLWLKLWIWMLGKANFKDRGRLKRGQFVTSIAEMQEAMSYWIGYRKTTPTREEIRSAYQAFAGRHETAPEDQTKPPMITTTKTTRGMIITVCNYNKFQDFRNYESHSETHDDNAAKPPTTPHDRERMRKKGNGRELHPDALRLSRLLADLILANNPKNAQLQEGKLNQTVSRWAQDIDGMLHHQNRSPEEVQVVIEWCQADSFWRCNILGGGKLRKQYDQLVMQMQRVDEKSGQGGAVVPIAAGRKVF